MLKITITYKIEIPHDVKMAMLDRVSRIEVDKTKVVADRLSKETFDRRVEKFESDVVLLPNSDFKHFLIDKISELKKPLVKNSEKKWYEKVIIKIADILFI